MYVCILLKNSFRRHCKTSRIFFCGMLTLSITFEKQFFEIRILFCFIVQLWRHVHIILMRRKKFINEKTPCSRSINFAPLKICLCKIFYFCDGKIHSIITAVEYPRNRFMTRYLLGFVSLRYTRTARVLLKCL